ncbi:hypothetical protein WQ53_08285 [Pseudoxanthomonas suwonensis]|uniref:Uncharacterized protein n=2 Tax=Pseudoxanthomonas suwonensis TaxID=314722 RepID=A0A0E3UN99_9GAMM|nr:hypothetical protein WQ53_08285 [Pseudoxanthomonas suwonensis]
MGGLVAVLCVAGAQASNINDINNGMPNRISMNVTTAKQTQGATFGEKVDAGLHAAGGKGVAPQPLLVECGSIACVIVFPDGNGYRADLQALALAPLEPAQGEAVRRQPQAASLVGSVMPGAGVVSAAVSSVGALAGGGSGGAAAASYARNATVAAAAVPPDAGGEPGEVDLSQPLADGDYQLVVVAQKPTAGLKDTLKTQVRTAAPQQVRIAIGFSVEDGVLKTRHDTAKNSIGNIR